MHERIAASDWPALLAWREQAPNATRAHPTTEHLFPFFFALEAAAIATKARVIHRSIQFGSLALDALAFD